MVMTSRCRHNCSTRSCLCRRGIDPLSDTSCSLGCFKRLTGPWATLLSLSSCRRRPVSGRPVGGRGKRFCASLAALGCCNIASFIRRGSNLRVMKGRVLELFEGRRFIKNDRFFYASVSWICLTNHQYYQSFLTFWIGFDSTDNIDCTSF